MSKGKTVTSTQTDPQLMAMYQDVFDEGKSLYNTPFQPFTGEGVAKFTPDQLFIQDQARDMYGKSMGFDPRNQLNELAGQGPQSVNVKSLLDGDIGAYQNPFRQQVIDNTLSDLDRARQMQIQSDQDAAIGQGAFGGSRSAILESETNRNYFDKAGDITSKLNQRGFDSAMNLMGQDINRQFDADRFNSNLGMQNRNFQAGLYGNQLADQYRNFGLLSGIGNQQQGLNQAQNDFDYNEFLRGYDDPFRRFSALAQGAGYLPGDSSRTEGYKPGTAEKIGTAAQTIGAVMGLFSDKRLKDNITLVGKSKGHNIYKWTWNDVAKKLGVNTPEIGVLAQEVMEKNPDAVTKHDSGYYMVNYGAL